MPAPSPDRGQVGRPADTGLAHVEGLTPARTGRRPAARVGHAQVRGSGSGFRASAQRRRGLGPPALAVGGRRRGARRDRRGGRRGPHRGEPPGDHWARRPDPGDHPAGERAAAQRGSAAAGRGRLPRRVRPAGHRLHAAGPDRRGHRVREGDRPAARHRPDLPPVGRRVPGRHRQVGGRQRPDAAAVLGRHRHAGDPVRPVRQPDPAAGPRGQGARQADLPALALGDGPAQPAGEHLDPAGLHRRLAAHPGHLQPRRRRPTSPGSGARPRPASPTRSSRAVLSGRLGRRLVVRRRLHRPEARHVRGGGGPASWTGPRATRASRS